LKLNGLAPGGLSLPEGHFLRSKLGPSCRHRTPRRSWADRN
jgi:hypothetical protein